MLQSTADHSLSEKSRVGVVSRLETQEAQQPLTD
jgi:hypothetical protein